MKNESLVYERPEAEEVKMVVESSFLSGNTEDPNCPTYGTCSEDYDICLDHSS